MAAVRTRPPHESASLGVGVFCLDHCGEGYLSIGRKNAKAKAFLHQIGWAPAKGWGVRGVERRWLFNFLSDQNSHFRNSDLWEPGFATG